MSNKPLCAICGEPMPEGEAMFKFHGYSGPCPRPPMPKKPTAQERIIDFLREWARGPYADSDPASYIESFTIGCVGLLKELEAEK